MTLCTRTPEGFKVRLTEGIIAAFVAVLVFLVYANSLDGPFVFDDHQNIRDNRALHLTDLDADSLWTAAFTGPSAARTVANISSP